MLPRLAAVVARVKERIAVQEYRENTANASNAAEALFGGAAATGGDLLRTWSPALAVPPSFTVNHLRMVFKAPPPPMPPALDAASPSNAKPGWPSRLLPSPKVPATLLFFEPIALPPSFAELEANPSATELGEVNDETKLQEPSEDRPARVPSGLANMVTEEAVRQALVDPQAPRCAMTVSRLLEVCGENGLTMHPATARAVANRCSGQLSGGLVDCDWLLHLALNSDPHGLPISVAVPPKALPPSGAAADFPRHASREGVVLGGGVRDSFGLQVPSILTVRPSRQSTPRQLLLLVCAKLNVSPDVACLAGHPQPLCVDTFGSGTPAQPQVWRNFYFSGNKATLIPQPIRARKANVTARDLHDHFTPVDQRLLRRQTLSPKNRSLLRADAKRTERLRAGPDGTTTADSTAAPSAGFDDEDRSDEYVKVLTALAWGSGKGGGKRGSHEETVRCMQMLSVVEQFNRPLRVSVVPGETLVLLPTYGGPQANELDDQFLSMREDFKPQPRANAASNGGNRKLSAKSMYWSPPASLTSSAHRRKKQNFRPEKVLSWNPRQVATYIVEKNLDGARPQQRGKERPSVSTSTLLFGAGVNGAQLVWLTDTDLEQMGVADAYTRHAILVWTEMLAGMALRRLWTNRPRDIMAWQPRHVAAWLFVQVERPLLARAAMRLELTPTRLLRVVPPPDGPPAPDDAKELAEESVGSEEVGENHKSVASELVTTSSLYALGDAHEFGREVDSDEEEDEYNSMYKGKPRDPWRPTASNGSQLR